MSLLVRSEIRGRLVNPLNVHDKFSHHNTENLPRPSQMPSSKKTKNFSQIFSWTFGTCIKFSTVLKKHKPHSLSIS